MNRHNKRLMAHKLRQFADYADDVPLNAAVAAASLTFAVVAVAGSLGMRWKARAARALARRLERENPRNH